MLRIALILIGIILLAAGAVSAITATGSHAVALLVGGAVLTLGVAYERWRYTGLVSRPSGNWQRTAERFIDPESGRLTEVWYDPETGARHYVESHRKK